MIPSQKCPAAEPGLRVLVVEDDTDVAQLADAVLSRQTTPRFEVHSAGTLSEGLRLLGEAVFDAAVLDLGLPDSRGVATVEAARTRFPLLPIVVLSATDDAGTIHAAMRKGAQDYLFKGQAGLHLLPRSILFAAERKRAEEALRESEARYRTLFESSRDAIMTLFPPDWRFTSANASTLEVFGAKDAKEFVCLAPWEVSPQRQPDGEDSARKAARMIGTAMEKGSHFFEWTYRRIGGDAFPATVLLTRVEFGGRAGLQATVRDVTAQKGPRPSGNGWRRPSSRQQRSS